MKKLIVCSFAAGLGLVLTGCVAPMPGVTGVAGSIYTDVRGGVTATANAASPKVGQATSKGILGFASGDSSIKAAAANAGITKIQHVDYHTTSILGVYAETTTVVYGE